MKIRVTDKTSALYSLTFTVMGKCEGKNGELGVEASSIPETTKYPMFFYLKEIEIIPDN